MPLSACNRFDSLSRTDPLVTTLQARQHLFTPEDGDRLLLLIAIPIPISFLFLPLPLFPLWLARGVLALLSFFTTLRSWRLLLKRVCPWLWRLPVILNFRSFLLWRGRG